MCNRCCCSNTLLISMAQTLVKTNELIECLSESLDNSIDGISSDIEIIK